MTQYAGELIEVTVTADDFDEDDLTELTVDSMEIEIRTTTGDAVVALTAMTWDAERLLWYYHWDTEAGSVAPGTYRAKCLLTDVLGKVSFEYKRIRLARPYF